MTYSFDGYNYMIRLEKGERLAACLEQFMGETRIGGAWVSGVGGALEATLGCYLLEAKEFTWKTYAGVWEIASLQGNLAADEQGKMTFHLHGVLADEQSQTIGGHVKDLTAAATVELFVHRTYQPLRRAMDKDIGLQLLQLGEPAEG